MLKSYNLLCTYIHFPLSYPIGHLYFFYDYCDYSGCFGGGGNRPNGGGGNRPYGGGGGNRPNIGCGYTPNGGGGNRPS